MSQILAASIGSYPRTGETKDQQRYRRGFAHFENKEISAHAFRDVEQSVLQEIIREQLAAGVDEVTDGLVSWIDPLSHACKDLSGVKFGGLARYFDTNFYYRVPRLVSKPKIQTQTVAVEYAYAKEIASKPLRAVFTGPFTVATHTLSDAKAYQKLPARIELFTDIIAAQINAVVAKGAQIVQIDEPALTRQPEKISDLKKVFEKLKAACSGELILALTFGPILPLYDALFDTPFDGFNLDFTRERSALFDAFRKRPLHKPLGWGVIDARNTKMESADALAEELSPLLKSGPAAKYWITPSTGLEFVPRDVAQEKLAVASKVRDLCGGLTPAAPVHG
jgi:5-methyltetrahydropteroyltriglutamate--homocysteine methyltransferase